MEAKEAIKRIELFQIEYENLNGLLLHQLTLILYNFTTALLLCKVNTKHTHKNIL